MIKRCHTWVKPDTTKKGRADQIKSLKIKLCLTRLIEASVHCLYLPRFKSQDKD